MAFFTSCTSVSISLVPFSFNFRICVRIDVLILTTEFQPAVCTFLINIFPSIVIIFMAGSELLFTYINTRLAVKLDHASGTACLNAITILTLLATENIIMACAKKGGDRQELHEVIRTHSMEAGKKVKMEGEDNDLLERLAKEPAIAMNQQEIETTNTQDIQGTNEEEFNSDYYEEEEDDDEEILWHDESNEPESESTPGPSTYRFSARVWQKREVDRQIAEFAKDKPLGRETTTCFIICFIL